MEPALKLDHYEPVPNAVLPVGSRKRKQRVPLPVLICLMAALFVCCAFTISISR